MKFELQDLCRGQSVCPQSGPYIGVDHRELDRGQSEFVVRSKAPVDVDIGPYAIKIPKELQGERPLVPAKECCLRIIPEPAATATEGSTGLF